MPAAPEASGEGPGPAARARRTNYLFFNVFSSVTLLTFVLFWMIFYNLCHIF